jgi:hypothetical protein
VEWSKVGNIVTWRIGSAITGTSNGTGCSNSTADIIPSNLRNATFYFRVPIQVLDNGTRTQGYIDINANGSFNLYTSVSGGAFTSSGTKGVAGNQIVSYGV